MKGKALRRAIETGNVSRISGDIPLIQDKTELISPKIAQQMLKANKHNRPINWKRVERYADLMAKGKWQLTPQGIIFDKDGNLLTGQQRLWAIVYADTSVYMRVSRGSPASIGKMLDRGMVQSARDLATRGSGRTHSPQESSMARAMLILAGNTKPTTDELGDIIEGNADKAEALLKVTEGTKKTKAVLMILSALCVEAKNLNEACSLARHVEKFVDDLELKLRPENTDKCWGRGASFVMAMEYARDIILKR